MCLFSYKITKKNGISLAESAKSRKFVVKIRIIMPENVQDIAKSIDSKVRVIVERQAMLSERIVAERAEAERLRNRVEELSARVEQLKAENEYLSVMRAVSVTPQQAEQSRALLAGLVREIDRCIAELKAC